MPLGTRVLGTRVLCCGTRVSTTRVCLRLHGTKKTKDSTLFVTFTSHFHLPEHALTLLNTQTYKPQTLTPSAAENPSVVEDSCQRPLTVNTLSLFFTPKHTNPKPSLHWRQKTHRRQKTLVGNLSLSFLTVSHWGQFFSFRVTSFIWNFNGFKIRNIEEKKNTKLILCFYQ